VGQCGAFGVSVRGERNGFLPCERGLPVLENRVDRPMFGVVVHENETFPEDKTGKIQDWHDVDLSAVDWDEIWAMIAEVEEGDECGDSCTL